MGTNKDFVLSTLLTVNVDWTACSDDSTNDTLCHQNIQNISRTKNTCIVKTREWEFIWILINQ